MTQITSGHVADRPFAQTVFAIATKRFSGDFILEQAGRSYLTTWHHGYIVAAHSPAPSDTIARVALSAGLINSSQLSTALRAMAKDSNKSQIEVIAEVASLSSDHVALIRQRVLAGQAIRMFALEEAIFTLDSSPTLTADQSLTPIDPRWLIFHGLAVHYSEERLVKEVSAALALRVVIAKEAEASLVAFGFNEEETRGVAYFRDSARTFEEMRHALPGLDRRRALALFYALAATNSLEASAETSAPVAQVPDLTEKVGAPVPPQVHVPQTASDEAEAVFASVATVPNAVPPQSKTRKPAKPAIAHSTATSNEDATEDRQSPRELIAKKLAQIAADSSYFDILEVPKSASKEELQLAYFRLAKTLHPDRLRAQQIAEIEQDAHNVFAYINQAHSVLSNASKRAHYLKVLEAGGERAYRQQQRDAEQLAMKIVEAESAFQHGLLAIRTNHFEEAVIAFELSVELNPEEGEHHALFAWSTWCAAHDKDQVRTQVLNSLKRATFLSPKCVSAIYYRGQIAKQLGDMDTASACFTKVLQLQPGHREAALEMRLIEKRTQSTKQPEKKGFFGRRKP